MGAVPKQSPRNYWSSADFKGTARPEPAAKTADAAPKAAATQPQAPKSSFYRQGVLVPGGLPARPGTRSRSR